MASRIRVLKNGIQNYPWGSRTAIAELLGAPNEDNRPQAELWMGAHPLAPSQMICEDGLVGLDAAIDAAPEEILGGRVAAAFSNKLPFLFKVLAAAEPLSIQAHPNAQQAREGFERENRAGIPLSAFHRNYRDDNAKPEMICALTPLWALRGFRRIESIPPLLERLAGRSLREELAALRKKPDREGLKRFFHALMSMPEEKKRGALAEAAEIASRSANRDPVCHWVVKLSQRYPGDIGTLCPALLNLVRLEPDEALYLPAGELHAYLEGVGVEIMANSDNVVRGGLTTRHIDVEELLRILTFESRDVEILAPRPSENGEKVWPAPAPEFRLSIVEVGPAVWYESARLRSVEILLCVGGEARITEGESGQPTPLRKGVSMVVPAVLHSYRIEGEARIFKASVPLDAIP